MFAQLQAGVPMWTAVGWFITNTAEALIGAFCITRFSDGKPVFESVRGVFSFVVFGVLIAPLATSFLDAAGVVITGWGRGYWPLGAERFWTNALAELTVVPTIVLCYSNGVSWIRKTSPARLGEASLLAIATVLVTILVFSFQPVSPATTTPALLYIPLPLLLWATVRFGSGGLSLSVLCIALVSIWYMLHGREPFPSASLRQNVLSLQILLCMVVVPLMFLSAVMAEARRTQQSLRSMSGSLIAAQEQERHRIARELHDDYNQRLAMLAIDLERLAENDRNASFEASQRLRQLSDRASELGVDLHSLSHRLHSSTLESLGLVEGVKAFCQEFEEQQGVQIDFSHENIPRGIPEDAALCLFRIAQEGLRNFKRHSGANRAKVRLEWSDGSLHLSVSDRGRGFDWKRPSADSGIGIRSMEERLRVLAGRLEIHSQPLEGTRIDAWLPCKVAGQTSG
jgi:signal transduction histidine kinase